LGAVNAKGVLTPTWAAGEPVEAQIQSESPDELARMSENVDVVETTRQAWFHGAPGSAPKPLDRETGAGGDIIQRVDGSWWLVTAVLDDYTRAGWTRVRLTRQVKGPESIDG
jgi:hypothetical protein